MADLKGKTKSGFSYCIKEEALDNMEVLELLSKLDSGDVSVLPAVLLALFGEKQKTKFYDHLRKSEGMVKVSSAGRELSEIFMQQNTVKKS